MPDLIKMEYIPCPLCGADDTRFIFERKDHRFLISDQSFHVVQCRSCSLVYVNPRPTEGEIHQFYSDDFYEVAYSPEQTLLKKEKELKAKYDKVKQFAPGRLLDIGCYKGEFMYYMKLRGWSASGVEFSHKPPNLFNLDIYYGRLTNAPFPPESFDLVTLWAVFEHVYDPQGMLEEINHFLKPHGSLIMLITNFNSVPGRFLRHDDVPRHVIMFTRKTISKMLTRHGLSPISFHCSQDIFSGSNRGLFNYIVKLLAGERIEEVVAQNRRPDCWHVFSSQIKGVDSRLMRFVDRLDIAVAPYLDKILDGLLLGFILTVKAVKINSQQKRQLTSSKSVINPHFDHNRVIWKDEYSGLYQPVDYSQQFDHEWRLFLEKKIGFRHHTGVETDDAWIDDRVFDLTGVEGYILKQKVSISRVTQISALPLQDRSVGGRQSLDLKFSINHFRGKRCLDVACGAGRWTKTLIALGAIVKSIDVSEHALKSVRRFNDDVECLDLFDIAKRLDLHEVFDFTLCWGAVMVTHDPKLAFENIARTVKPGGECYVMVYAPTLHNSPEILAHRQHYHKNLKTFEEKLAYAYSIADRPENAINYLDMLNTFYNWVVEENTIHNWFWANGFMDVITLNASEKNPCAYHVFGRKRKFDPPFRDDYGNRIPRAVVFNPDKTIPLPRQFQHENGFGWQVSLSDFSAYADDIDCPYRSNLVLLEDGQPLWFQHALHDEIRKFGKGLYSHWRDMLLFSTSDNTDPNTNNRTYHIVFANFKDTDNV